LRCTLICAAVRNVLPLLHGIPIVSARTNFEAQFPGAPLSWKAAAFAYTLHERFNITFDAPKLVVSVGDSDEEKIALRIAANQHAVVSTATLKLLPHPSPAALAVQLDMVCAQLPGVCRGSSTTGSGSGSGSSTTETEIVFSSAAVAQAVQTAEDAAAAVEAAAVAHSSATADSAAAVAAVPAGLSVTVLSSSESSSSSSEGVSCLIKPAVTLTTLAVDTEPTAPPTPPPTPPTVTVVDQASSSISTGSSSSSSCAVQERSRSNSSMGASPDESDSPLSSTVGRMVAPVLQPAAPMA
jgi:hypothetical protein